MYTIVTHFYVLMIGLIQSHQYSQLIRLIRLIILILIFAHILFWGRVQLAHARASSCQMPNDVGRPGS